MLLTSTSDVLSVTTTTAANIDVQANWADITTTSFSPSRTNTRISSGTTTTIVDHPATSTQRRIISILLRNTHASSTNVVTVNLTDGANSIAVYSRSLLAGESLVYDGQNWNLYNAAGVPVDIYTSGFADVQSFTSQGYNTWVVPTTFTPRFVKVVMWGGGGGGGSGSLASSNIIYKGGSGGGGACYAEKTFLFSELGGNQQLYVAKGGSGALNAGYGTGGENSWFGTAVRMTAYGGGAGYSNLTGSATSGGGGGGGIAGAGGAGGTSAGAAGAPGGALPYVSGMGTPGPITVITTHCGDWGGGGGGGSTNAQLTCAGGSSLFGGGGGGAGGSNDVSKVGYVGSAGGSSNSVVAGDGAAAGNNNSGSVGSPGNNGANGTSLIGGGGGGGGGAAYGNYTLAGGAGGKGGSGGGGGGGGGAGEYYSAGTAPSGSGGDGGDGLIYVFSW